MNKDEILKSFDGKINTPATGNQEKTPVAEEDAKYEALKNISYKEMMNSKIQASAVKDQALKYSGTALNAAGYGTQGLSESSRVGIFNNFNNKVMGAEQTHQDNLLAIENQKITDKETKRTEDWQTLMTMAQGATSIAELDEVKSMLDSGDYSDQQRKYFDFYYKSYKNQLSTVNDANTTTPFTYANEQAFAYDQSGGSVTTSGQFNKETETLKGALANGSIAKGTYIQVRNNSKQDLFLYYGKDGNIYYVSKEEFKKQSDDKKVNIVGTSSAINKGPLGNAK